MVSYSSALETIDKEIAPTYIGGCIQWVDDNRGMAWSMALNKLESTLMTSKDDFVKQLALNEYVDSAKKLIRDFKMNRQVDTTDDFIKSIQKDFGI